MAVVRKTNSTIQNLSGHAVHDWYRFVLAYPDHLVSEMLERFGIRPGQVVLDPFVGTGTTLVECKRLGIDSIGIDANPFAVFASRVKTTWNIDLAEFDRQREALLRYLREALAELGDAITFQRSFADLLSGEPPPPDLPLPVAEPVADLDAMKALIPAGAISDLPLRKVLLARQAIDALPGGEVSDLFRLALAAVAVLDMSNLGFGPEVYVRARKRRDADLHAALVSKLSKIRDDLAAMQEIVAPGTAAVFAGDARQLAEIVDRPVDCVIMSPPYPNEKDYTRITRLELVLFEFIRDRGDLRALKEDMLRSHTRNIFKADDDSRFVADIPEIQALAHQIERARTERGATSGFERLYHRVVTEYFGGMFRVLDALQQVVAPGGKLAIVVGDQMSYFQVPIRTAELLSLLACRKLAFREVETRLWRTRLATATRREVEEHILILERC